MIVDDQKIRTCLRRLSAAMKFRAKNFVVKDFFIHVDSGGTLLPLICVHLRKSAAKVLHLRSPDHPISAGQLSICTVFGRLHSIKSVVRRILTVASLICLASLAVFYPVIEGLDRWDAPGPFSDSEIQIIAVLTLVGAMFVLARLLVTVVLSFLQRVLLYVRRSSRNSGEVSAFRFLPVFDAGASPPLIVTLRI